MAQKPAKAMDTLTARKNYWVPADSRSEFVKELCRRYGGDDRVWKDLALPALDDGTFIFEYQKGKPGYRTQNEEERVQKASTPSRSRVSTVRSNTQAVMV